VQRLERYEGEVEGTVELGGVGVGIELYPALIAEVVYEEAGIAHPLYVLLVRVEHGDAPHLARHLRRRDPAYGARANDEHACLYHSLSGVACAIMIHRPSSRQRSSLQPPPPKL
jgi:hypothetical protein